jgi:hypothetical protein
MWLQLEIQLVDNKPLNKTSVTTTRGSSSGQQPPLEGECVYT